MEKVTTRRTIIKTVEEEVEMDIFISKDGTIFDTEEEAQEYADNLTKAEEGKNHPDFSYVVGEWYAKGGSVGELCER